MVRENQVLQGRYRVGALLGEGSQGAVWSATDEVHDRPVAVKFVAAGSDDIPNARSEAALLRMLDLPGVVRIQDEWEDDAGWFLVMDQVDGTPFPRSASWHELTGLLSNLLATLSLIHGRGVVHGDLKPSNLVVADGRCVLLDFGFAVDRAARSPRGGFSLLYAAPEVLLGHPTSEASDVFSVGVLALQALGLAPGPALEPQRWARDLQAACREHPRAVLLAPLLDPRPGSRPTATEALRLLRAPSEEPLVLVDPSPVERTAARARALLDPSDDPDAELRRWIAAGLARDGARGVEVSYDALGRLAVALQGKTPELHEALDLAARSIGQASLRTRAEPVLRWWLHETRHQRDEATHQRCLAAYATLALFQESASALHRALLECSRSNEDGSDVERLLRWALEARFRRRFDQVEQLAAGLPERWPSSLALGAALARTWSLRADPEGLAHFLQALGTRWADRPDLRIWVDRWTGLSAYQRGDYALAARCARGDSVGDLCNRSAAVLELCRSSEAVSLAEEALARAIDAPPPLVAQALWLTRYTAYRDGRLLSARPELPASVAPTSPSHGARLAWTEAAFAWRAGDAAMALQLVDQARRGFAELRQLSFVRLCEAFAVYLQQDRVRASALLPRVEDVRLENHRVQFLALLAGAGATTRADPVALAGSAWTPRLDLLTPAEVNALQR